MKFGYEVALADGIVKKLHHADDLADPAALQRA